MSKEKNKRVLMAALKNIVDNPPSKTSMSGICGWVSAFVGYHYDKQRSATVALLSNYWCDWEHYSGNENYPIAHPTELAGYAYNMLDLWDLTTEYGQRRMNLVKYIIERLEKELE